MLCTDSLEEDDSKTALATKPARMIDLFTNTIFFFNLLIISTAWFATGMMFYGLSIYMPEFKSTDIRLITFLLGLAEIPADMVPIVALNRFDISIVWIEKFPCYY